MMFLAGGGRDWMCSQVLQACITSHHDRATSPHSAIYMIVRQAPTLSYNKNRLQRAAPAASMLAGLVGRGRRSCHP